MMYKFEGKNPFQVKHSWEIFKIRFCHVVGGIINMHLIIVRPFGKTKNKIRIII